MKQLSQYIIEKLKINSKSKISKQDCTPDTMNDDKTVIFDDIIKSSEQFSKLLEFVSTNKKYYNGFLLSKGKPVTEYIKKRNCQYIVAHVDLDMLLEEILDDGYNNFEISIEYGRIHIISYDKSNSYEWYIYSLTHDALEQIIEFLVDIDWNDRVNQDLEFLLDMSLYVEITDTGVNENLKDVIVKVGKYWRIRGHAGKGTNTPKEGYWKAKYHTRKDAENALKAYFANK